MKAYRKRYVMISTYPENIDYRDVYMSIKNCLRELFGELTVIQSRIRLVRKKPLVISVKSEFLPHIILAITSVGRLDENTFTLNVHLVGTTIREIIRKIGTETKSEL